ncbi:hypothetical protein AHF37_01428 [Paragonimus kellicotti]|nr:hypothetical protein AHF37_01428 [Paragonimus kellicotti]
MGFTKKQLFLIFGMLVTGTINTISKKLQLDCTALGYYNHSANDTRTEHHFNKPWFQTLLMFLGEVLCLFGFFVIRYRKRKRLEREGTYHQIVSDPNTLGILNTPLFNWYFGLPACCDLLGTTLAGIGLMFVDASIWQMMRGSLIIFAAVLSIIFLKRRLFGFHWTGMLCTVIGLALVGTKSVFSGHSSQHTAAQSAIGKEFVHSTFSDVYTHARSIQIVSFPCINRIGVSVPATH